MAWWSRMSAARMLLIAVANAHRTDAVFAYRQAGRRLENGLVDPFFFAGVEVSFHWVSGERFIVPSPIPEWQSILPAELGQALAASSDAPMDTIQVGKLRVCAPRLPAHGLWLPPSADRPTWGFNRPWNILFPGQAALELPVLRDACRTILHIARDRPAEAARLAATMARERTAKVDFPSELPMWELRANESEEDVLSDAVEQTGVRAASWSELLANQRFLVAIERPMPVIVAFGWGGAIALQLATRLRANAVCQYEGCARYRSAGRTRYCDEHARLAAAEANASRQRRHRARRERQA